MSEQGKEGPRAEQTRQTDDQTGCQLTDGRAGALPARGTRRCAPAMKRRLNNGHVRVRVLLRP